MKTTSLFNYLAFLCLSGVSLAKASNNAAPEAETEDYELFEPYPHPEEFETAVLFEQFVDSPEELFKKWKVSHARKADDLEEFSYVGEWAIEEPTVAKGFAGDKGLVMKSPAAHHAISRKFNEVLDNTDKTFVLQYEVKLQQGLQCGGAYVKLLSAEADLDNTEFSNETPYVIMFGPDKCGSTDKIHFILKSRNPESGEIGEHHLVLPPRTRSGLTSSLYTLIIRPDQQFEIRVNGLPFHTGNLTDTEQFEPPITVSPLIEDVTDVKPEDWDDREVIPDPEQTEKPEDWDETLPMRIPDTNAKKPKDWDESLEAYVADPDAAMPEYWDESEDGEWVAPLVRNPECEGLSGCGKWTPPTIRNPDFKGKWKQPSIPNPDYQGEWSPRLIPNPDFDENYKPSNFDPIGAIGLELWTMQSDILFDNFYIGHSVQEAEWLGNATWSPKFFAESKREESVLKKRKQEAQAEKRAASKDNRTFMELVNTFLENPKQVALISYMMFWYDFDTDRLQAIKDHPYIVATIATGLVIIIAIASAIVGALKNLIFGKPAKANKKIAKSKGAATATKSEASEGQTSSAKPSETSEGLKSRASAQE